MQQDKPNLQELLKQLQNLRQNMQIKQSEQMQKFNQMMELLDQVISEIKLNGQFQFNQYYQQLQKYLGLSDGSKYKAFNIQEDILKSQPNELIIFQGDLNCRKCSRNNILYFYLREPYVLCDICCQRYQNGMKFDQFQQVYKEARKNYLNFQNIYNILDKLKKIQIEENQFFNEMKMYYISMLRGKQDYFQASQQFKELIKLNVQITDHSVKDLCEEINLQNQHLFKIDLKKLDQLNNDIEQTFKTVYDLRMKYQYPEIQNSQFNQVIIYHDKISQDYWVDVDQYPHRTFNEFISKLNMKVNKITSEDQVPVNQDYDIIINKNGQMQIFHVDCTQQKQQEQKLINNKK